ncbi:alpha/beta hydrolase [Filibacter tadaridae]|uniref:Alpha/beta hydrolase family protein n=1 Tax=Filibacter tadaridae TaxID=2483811 RepID=A0A3P5X6Q2_9BACL|nr:alpha/beta hydrolase [Filibacter tadaridae]VDC23987.1 Alpha/beta hydrolase family protein [Filibacter tadaridae]
MSKIRINWKKVVILFFAVFLVFQIIGSFFFYGLAVKRGPKEFLQENADLEVSNQAMDLFLKGDWIDWVAAQKFERLTLPSRDGLKLSGYYLPASKPTDKLVILTHGYLGNAKQMGLFGQYYHKELGYNIFMPDARGHGKSEGDYYGFGWPDRLDLIDWTELLVKKLGDDTEVAYHGLSMGAATVLMASGEEELPGQVKAIIADSPYESVYQLFAYQMSRMFHLPAFPLLDSTSVLTKIRAGYSFREASALKAVEKANVPILYIHGESDTFVPTEMAENLYQHTSSDAELLLVPKANHGESFALAKEEYKMKMDHFLNRYID